MRDARSQLDHNKRLVNEGLLAPIDVVSVEAQVAGLDQSVYSALEDVSRAENNLKGLIAQKRPRVDLDSLDSSRRIRLI